MQYVILWVGFSIAAGVIAHNKGRSGFGYFLLSLVFSPLIGILFAVVATTRVGQPTPDTHYRCPDCQEFILIGARVCKHCGCRIAHPDDPVPILTQKVRPPP